ncbi:Metal-independent phosphoserine phosphatase [Thalictrum thalictroides]|uniref:Metal-independent phosphoserine phosphatase n=1 Tax=Thalictrum thalictroides TaxID=46969 RepID=A0A7J6V2E0_THATH|nr:Metal-independent phosphoserine phosphatase [Thalictrum thalictroides]
MEEYVIAYQMVGRLFLNKFPDSSEVMKGTKACSDILIAHKTCKRHNQNDCQEVIVVPKLKARNVRSLQVLTWGEIQEKDPHAYHVFFCSQNDFEIPGGRRGFFRSVAALEEIVSSHKGTQFVSGENSAEAVVENLSYT